MTLSRFSKESLDPSCTTFEQALLIETLQFEDLSTYTFKESEKWYYSNECDKDKIERDTGAKTFREFLGIHSERRA